MGRVLETLRTADANVPTRLSVRTGNGNVGKRWIFTGPSGNTGQALYRVRMRFRTPTKRRLPILSHRWLTLALTGLPASGLGAKLLPATITGRG